MMKVQRRLQCSGPNYFKTMETPLLRGRDFAETDRKGRPEIVVINETLAALLLAARDALGKRLSLAGPEGHFSKSSHRA